jgi:hypothetical protein
MIAIGHQVVIGDHVVIAIILVTVMLMAGLQI